MAQQVVNYVDDIPKIVDRWSKQLDQISEDNLDYMETFIKFARFQNTHTTITNLNQLRIGDHIWVIFQDRLGEKLYEGDDRSFDREEGIFKVRQFVNHQEILINKWGLDGGWMLDRRIIQVGPEEFTYHCILGENKVFKIFKCQEDHSRTGYQIKYHDIDIDHGTLMLS